MILIAHPEEIQWLCFCLISRKYRKKEGLVSDTGFSKAHAPDWWCLVIYNLHHITSQESLHNWLCSHLLPDWSQQGVWPYYVSIRKCYIAKRLLYNMLYNLKLLYMTWLTSQQGVCVPEGHIYVDNIACCIAFLCDITCYKTKFVI